MLININNHYILPSFIINAESQATNSLDLFLEDQDQFNFVINEVLPLITKENIYPCKDNFDSQNFKKVVIKIISLLPPTIKDQIAYNYIQMREATQTITDV
jgi:hypothetical protein